MSAKLMRLLLCSIATLVVANERSRENEDWVFMYGGNHRRPLRSSIIAAPKLFAVGGYLDGAFPKSVESYNFQTQNWGPEPSSPFSRSNLGAVTLNGKLYAIGGHYKTVDVFDPTTQNWTSAPNMNTERSLFGVGVLNGKIYVVGGMDGSSILNSVEMFDPQSNKWTTVGRGMDTKRTWLAVGVLSGSLYAVGGSNKDPVFEGRLQNLNTVEKLDPVTGVWSFVAPMNSARSWHCVAVLNEKLYAIGGENGQYEKSAEVYDPVSDRWSLVARLSVQRDRASAVAYNGRIYVVGGFAYLDSTEVYDPLTNTWSTLPARMSTGRYAHAVAVL